MQVKSDTVYGQSQIYVFKELDISMRAHVYFPCNFMKELFGLDCSQVSKE